MAAWPLDPTLILAGVALLALVALLVAVGFGIALMRRSGADAGRMAELTGRFDQMARAQSEAQARLAEGLQTQERALAATVEQRLAQLGDRVGLRLQESSTQAQQSLTELKERLAVIDAAQKNITELSTQVVGLQDILSNKQARGAFGEVQLEGLVRDAMPAASFEFQATLSNGKRVDCLLKLPQPPGPIAIDSKFPLEAYRALKEAKDEAALKLAQRDFQTAVRNHVLDIAGKYILAGETADWAVMFLPSEAVYAELHGGFTALVEEALRRRVSIASPSTLMALLTTIRAVLRDVRMREQAHVIQRIVGLLLEDVRRLSERVSNLQKHHEQVGKDLKDIATSSEQIQKRGERIQEVEIEESGATPTPAPLPAADLLIAKR
ncbi:MAG TPA: DNA recombination protein RmuC [Hypericibacter adhaerens]|uniref:DNA recombination protein RmuC n=1 Tax=Hypericibacter adhaerens TaxID=2602016 RepID=UPI002C1BF982|nr:DNA recombination protein RmuC [Hypericibacter adhaerens]HWA41973.1 DNA recombination protein RmuC [Hypericibacter adhaerens]